MKAHWQPELKGHSPSLGSQDYAQQMSWQPVLYILRYRVYKVNTKVGAQRKGRGGYHVDCVCEKCDILCRHGGTAEAAIVSMQSLWVVMYMLMSVQ